MRFFSRAKTNTGARLIKSGNAKVPWHPNEAYRNKIKAMYRLERKMERLIAEGTKQVKKYLDRWPNMDPKLRQKKESNMLLFSKAIHKARLLRKAEQLQHEIDGFFNKKEVKHLTSREAA